MTFKGPFLPNYSVISALVFVPGTISPLALGRPGLGASDLSWDGQTGQGELVTCHEASACSAVRHIRASACRVYSSRDCSMAVILEKSFRAIEKCAR